MSSVPGDDTEGHGACRTVHAHLVELADTLTVCDSRIRRREPRGVHTMRVTLRRLRTVLATFAPLVTRDSVASLRQDLKWLAEELGSARDHDVIYARLKVLATAEDERSLVARIEAETRATGSVGINSALDSDRYSELRRKLTSLATDSGWTTGAEPPVALLRTGVRRDWKRVRRRVEDAGSLPRGAERNTALHEVRKAAKRLRYSAETLVPAYSKEAGRFARRAKRLQTRLGELQDSLVTQTLLREMAVVPGRSADELYILGGLGAQERLLCVQAEGRSEIAWAQLARKRNRRWLT
ncbi:MAG: CHAD domain-containing protein [Marmoricola sp.]